MRYEPGDPVTIKPVSEMQLTGMLGNYISVDPNGRKGSIFGINVSFIDRMCGKEFTISNHSAPWVGGEAYYLNDSETGDEISYYWAEEMLEPICYMPEDVQICDSDDIASFLNDYNKRGANAI